MANNNLLYVQFIPRNEKSEFYTEPQCTCVRGQKSISYRHGIPRVKNNFAFTVTLASIPILLITLVFILLKPNDNLIRDKLKKAEPCENFYDFVCRDWGQKNQIPTGKKQWGVFEILEKRTDDRIIEIMENDTDDIGDIPVFKQIKLFYEKCAELGNDLSPAEEEAVINVVWSILESYGGWPILSGENEWKSGQFNWTKSVADLSRKFRLTPLLDIYAVKIMERGVEYNAINISRPGPRFSSSHMPMQDYIFLLSKYLLGFNGITSFNENYLREQAFNVYKLHNKITWGKFSKQKKAMRIRRQFGFAEESGNMTLVTLQKMIDQFIGEENKTPIVEWFEILFNNSGVQFYEEDLYIDDIDYVLQVLDLIHSIDMRTLANYLHFQMVHQMLPMTSQNLRDLHSIYVSGKIKRSPVPREEMCAQSLETIFKFAMAQKLVKREFASSSEFLEARNEVTHMFELIRDSFRPLENSSGILQSVPDNVLNICIGFPDWIFDDHRVQAEYDGLNLNQTTYLEQALVLNEWLWNKQLNELQKTLMENECDWNHATFINGGAVAYMRRNEIDVPMGMLQRPIFMLGPNNTAHNYGSLGTTVGHEFGHILDRKNFGRNSLSSEEFCLIKQYNRFSMEILTNENWIMMGRKTLRENIADLVGLKLAYSAFKQEEYLLNRNENAIPNISNHPDQLTSDQQFFVSFAQKWCESDVSLGHWKDLDDVHSPGVFRVLGTLRNSEEFATAWNCPVGSKMNPDPREHKKCHLL